MIIESLHKLIVTKSLLSIIFAGIGGFIRQQKEEEFDEAPGDNFPDAVMYRR
ncbi:MAG: hypothetical protein KGJ11_07015 [Candidatus Omnitrophica bacterium]|nr:hypothetical protein [Candidatus Omnitrophota bacterium]